MKNLNVQTKLYRWLILALVSCLLAAPVHATNLVAEDHTAATVLAGAGVAISETQAIATAVNRLEATEQGLHLSNPRHTADFSPEGVIFTPKQGGPQWSWQLEQVSDAAISVQAVQPQSPEAEVVAYRRGIMTEQYLAKANSIEQQFILHQAPSDGADLVIMGAVESSGKFQTGPEGWEWRTAGGTVRLGQVLVFDANGQKIPARMEVTASVTQIVVDGAALMAAAYPVTVDPEIGADDFRISEMGSDTLFDGYAPDAAYNPLTNQYLVVWHGDTNTDGMVDGETEIWGQLINAETGWRVGSAFRISDMGPDGDINFSAAAPAVACNTINGQYLVVWHGDDVVNNEFEIYGQLLSGDGSSLGENDFRISYMGPSGSTAYLAALPDVAFSSTSQLYGVVWYGDTNEVGMVDNEYEIWGTAIAVDGSELSPKFKISSMGFPGDINYFAFMPAIAYDDINNNFLVVWFGKNDLAPAIDEVEIYGALVSVNTGNIIKHNILISRMGPNGNTNFYATTPDVVFNPTSHRYLIVWSGDHTTDDEFEVWGQFLDTSGNKVGTEIQISDVGSPGSPLDTGFSPAVTYNPTAQEYLVTWRADPTVDNEYEVYGQRLDLSGMQVGSDDFRISQMGTEGNKDFGAYSQKVVFAGGPNEYLVVWQGDDDTPPMVDDEFEIFGRRLDAAGADAGESFRISFMGIDDEYAAQRPAIAYNPDENQYLVVWHGDETTNNENEIWGQLIDAATGEEIRSDFRISTTWANGDPLRDAYNPSVAYSLNSKEYLVVWTSDQVLDNEFEIFGHYIEGASGQELGNDFRITHMGPDGDINYGAVFPSVAYNSLEHEFLVVWQGNSNTGGVASDMDEIWAQRLGDSSTSGFIGTAQRVSNVHPGGHLPFDAEHPTVVYNESENGYIVVWDNKLEIWGQFLDKDGAEVGSDFLLSDMGAFGGEENGVDYPAVAYNSKDGQYLVVWSGKAHGGLALDEYEIYGRIINAANGNTTKSDFLISSMGPAGDILFEAWNVDVVYNPSMNEYLVVWRGDDTADDEYEIYAQRVAANGDEIGEDDFPLSTMGSLTCGTACMALDPALAYSTVSDEVLVVWSGSDDTLPLAASEYEIFGQRYFVPGAVPGGIYLPMLVRAP